MVVTLKSDTVGNEGCRDRSAAKRLLVYHWIGALAYPVQLVSVRLSRQ